MIYISQPLVSQFIQQNIGRKKNITTSPTENVGSVQIQIILCTYSALVNLTKYICIKQQSQKKDNTSVHNGKKIYKFKTTTVEKKTTKKTTKTKRTNIYQFLFHKHPHIEGLA